MSDSEKLAAAVKARLMSDSEKLAAAVKAHGLSDLGNIEKEAQRRTMDGIGYRLHPATMAVCDDGSLLWVSFTPVTNGETIATLRIEPAPVN